MGVVRPLLVGHGRLVHLVCLSERCNLLNKSPSYLFRGSLSDCPMVVHPKGDQSEHGHVETDVPPGIGTWDVVLGFELVQPHMSEGGTRPEIQATSVARRSGNPRRSRWQTTPVY